MTDDKLIRGFDNLDQWLYALKAIIREEELKTRHHMDVVMAAAVAEIRAILGRADPAARKPVSQ